jgi:tripartite-type tricarboxylate transporter receptor subunit TctC
MVVGPAHMPAPVVTKLAQAFGAAVTQPSVRDHMILLGMVPQSSPPPDKLQDYINSEMVRWGKVVKTAGLAGTE